MMEMSIWGLSTNTWSVIGVIGSTVGTFITALSLFFAKQAIDKSSVATELQVLDSLFKDVRTLESDLVQCFPTWNHERKTAWCSSFYNTVEYICLIVNNDLVSTGALKKFFDGAVLFWRKQYDEHVKAGLIEDSADRFPEFKNAANSQRFDKT